MAIAAAAATVTVVPLEPSPLFAAGVAVEPDDFPDEALDVLLPSERLLSALSLTVGLVVPSVAVELIVRLPVPELRTAPFGRPAVVVSLTTLTATDAPIPLALPSAACSASAVAVFVRFEVAFRTRLPLTVTGVGDSTSE